MSTSSNSENEQRVKDDKDAERTFNRFDGSGDGKISVSELTEALKTLGPISDADAQALLKEVDSDGDGFISREEFMKFTRENRPAFDAMRILD